MKEFNHVHTNEEEGIARALAMYKETVSPSRDMLVNVLNQIPEIKEKLKADDRRAIRSPYIWVAFAQFVSVCMIAIVLYPTLAPTPAFAPATNAQAAYQNDPFYAVDQQVDAFESNLNQEDSQAVLANSAK